MSIGSEVSGAGGDQAQHERDGRLTMGKWLDAGVIRIAADVAGGRVIAATVHSERPRGLAAALAEHPPAAIPDLARLLFALCGTSHAIAAMYALRMAGAAITASSAETSVRRLAAERIVAHLQSTFMAWSAAVPTTAAEASALSRVLTAMRGSGVDGDVLITALGRLGITARPQSGSWAERLLAAAGHGGGGGQGAPDPLGVADDERVLAALDDRGEAFAAAPWLLGRRPETGPAARAALRGLKVVSRAERLGARLNEVVEAARLYARKDPLRPADWITTGRLAPGLGFCAVETPRGRLHHLVELHADGTVRRYLILAPTEWNFAADGPFAAALDGLAIEPKTARQSIERLALLYDPCVGCDVEVREFATHNTRTARRRRTAEDDCRGAL
jgi:uptake hydrogenase large subunit